MEFSISSGRSIRSVIRGRCVYPARYEAEKCLTASLCLTYNSKIEGETRMSDEFTTLFHKAVQKKSSMDRLARNWMEGGERRPTVPPVLLGYGLAVVSVL